MTTDIIDAEECAGLLRCTVERIEELARAGEIPGLKIGRNWLFVRSDLLAYLAEKAREEAQVRRMKRSPNAPVQLARPRRQTPPVLPGSTFAPHLASTSPQALRADLKPPPSVASDKDQVIEEYFHAGMKIQIYRDAGTSRRPTYFATVANPASKTQSGSVVDANSYAELKAAAEMHADRKALSWKRRHGEHVG